MNKKVHTLFLLFCCALTVLYSCTDNQPDAEQQGDITYLHISSSDVSTRSYPPDAALDKKITTIRVLAFDPTTGVCRSNKRYNAELGEIIKHEIEAGIYNLVFLANEPTSVQDALNNLKEYSELNAISYPESIINSTDIIPMSQEIKSVEILAKNKGAKILKGSPSYTEGVTYNPLVLKLSRLATRVDILLESVEDVTDNFKGVTFSNIPNGVPLLAADNGSFTRNITRTFNVVTDAGYFEKLTLTPEQVARGISWACKITRIVLPFSNFTPANNKVNAVSLTVNMENRYSPSCELKTVTGQSSTENNYTLPRDAALLLKGTIKTSSLELNIQVLDWGEMNGNWQVPQNSRLDVSTIEANITDFNGVRITFSSDMPVVKVLPYVYIGESGYVQMETNSVFNDLAVETDTQTTTTRFNYTYDDNSKTGTGYMDVILDEYNELDQKQVFRIILSAEGPDGKLQREIKINTEQNGLRVKYFGQWGFGYAGAFFRYNEKGERVIIGQIPKAEYFINFPTNNGSVPIKVGERGRWSAEITKGSDWIVLSSTPSFDPAIGTNKPGDPELYPVTPNEYKSEDGKYVQGRGRVYFRIGTTSTISSADAAPRYGVIKLRYTTEYGATEYDMYIRQGEAADYVMKDETIPGGILAGPRTGTVKFSPYNLTASQYLTNPNYSSHPQVPIGKGSFVKYPSQAGAFFQWYLPAGYSTKYRVAYNPATPIKINAGEWITETGFMSNTPIWDAKPATVPTGAPLPPDISYLYGIKSTFNLCPAGWRYPAEGPSDRLVFNGPFPNIYSSHYNQYVHFDPRDTNIEIYPKLNTGAPPPYDFSDGIKDSELRKSLFHTPIGGTASSTPEKAFIDDSKVQPGEFVVFNTTGRPDDKYYSSIADFLDVNYEGKNSFPEIMNNVTSQIGFYADGFYDRRPTRQVQNSDQLTFAVSAYNADIAYNGVVIANSGTKASVFFPMAGRRKSEDGSLMENGKRGYYWTSTAGPMNLSTPVSTWYLSIGWYPPLGPGYCLPIFGQSIRCVKE